MHMKSRGRWTILVSQLEGHTVGGEREVPRRSIQDKGSPGKQLPVTSNKPVASAAGGDSGRLLWSEKKGPDVLQARPGMRSWATNICATPAACLRATRGISVELDGTGRVQTSENLCWYNTEIGWLGLGKQTATRETVE